MSDNQLMTNSCKCSARYNRIKVAFNSKSIKTVNIPPFMEIMNHIFHCTSSNPSLVRRDMLENIERVVIDHWCL